MKPGVLPTENRFHRFQNLQQDSSSMVSACFTYESGEVEPSRYINRCKLRCFRPSPLSLHGNSHPSDSSYPRFCVSADIGGCALPCLPLAFLVFQTFGPIMEQRHEALRQNMIPKPGKPLLKTKLYNIITDNKDNFISSKLNKKNIEKSQKIHCTAFGSQYRDGIWTGRPGFYSRHSSPSQSPERLWVSHSLLSNGYGQLSP